jgi:DNA-binding transcriptional LysR family regulator
MIVPSRHPWSKLDMIKPTDMLTEKFILRENSSGTYIAVNDALKNAGLSIDELQPLLTLGNAEAIALAVQEGLGIGFVSKLVVNRLNLDQIKIVSIEGVDMIQHIYMGYQTRRPASAAQIAFWKFAQTINTRTFMFPKNKALEASQLHTGPNIS